MNILFTPCSIGRMEIKNRFVRSATYDGYADRRGHVTDRQVDLFSALARGGIGLIVTGIVSVQRNGRISPFQNTIDRDDCIPGLRRLTRAVHDHGAKVALQLFHGGREVGRFKPDLAVGPSYVENDPYCAYEYRAMTEPDILETIGAFAAGARRAREAGFDGVQIHGAHAYLASQFLSPFGNRREDEWGGGLEGRLRLHREILSAIHRETGPDFPVMIKLGVEDGFTGGLVLAEGLQAAKMLAEAGYDALEISSGLRGEVYEGTEFRTRVDRPGREAYFLAWAADVKKTVSVPVMAVGGLRRVELMAEVVQGGDADFVSLCRPFIREPELVRSWERGETNRPRCISCNQCFEAIRSGVGLACMVERRKAEKATSVSGDN